MKFKYNICYENTFNINGYITEKIFDCFIAGCVPIYLGAPNISDYIPNNTFIDRRNFNSDYELIQFLKKINEFEYSDYQDNILNFLKSDKAKKFTSSYTSKFIVEKIAKL
jgi:hypothetical protein